MARAHGVIDGGRPRQCWRASDEVEKGGRQRDFRKLIYLPALALLVTGEWESTSAGAERLGLKLTDSNGFVVINSIAADGLGAEIQSQSGRSLAVGDRIVAVNYNPVFDSDSAADLINSLESPLLLLHVRRRNSDSKVPEGAWIWRHPRSKPSALLGDRKIFAIVGGDTNDPDPKTGVAIEASLRYFTRCLRANVPDRQLALHRLSGEGFTVDGLVSAIRLAEEVATPDDTVIVYLCCHGSTDATAVSAVHGTSFTDQHVLWFANEKPLLRDQLLAALGRFDARLRVLITDSCRNRSDKLTRMLLAEGLQVLGEQRTRDARLRLANPLQDLLLVPAGIVDWYSCDVGEFSNGVEEGGLFTIGMCEAMQSADSGHWGEAQKIAAELLGDVSRISDKRLHQTPTMYRMIDIPPSIPPANRKAITYPATVVRPVQP